LKTFIGSGKEKFDGNVVNVSIDIENATPFIYEKSGRKYLTFDVSKLRQPTEYGKTHSASVWSPDGEKKESFSNDAPTPEENPFSDSDIPF